VSRLEVANARQVRPAPEVRLNGQKVEIAGFDALAFAKTLRSRRTPKGLAERKARLDRLATEHGQ
jgi:hypothetical protein